MKYEIQLIQAAQARQWNVSVIKCASFVIKTCSYLKHYFSPIISRPFTGHILGCTASLPICDSYGISKLIQALPTIAKNEQTPTPSQPSLLLPPTPFSIESCSRSCRSHLSKCHYYNLSPHLSTVRLFLCSLNLQQNCLSWIDVKEGKPWLTCPNLTIEAHNLISERIKLPQTQDS